MNNDGFVSKHRLLKNFTFDKARTFTLVFYCMHLTGSFLIIVAIVVKNTHLASARSEARHRSTASGNIEAHQVEETHASVLQALGREANSCALQGSRTGEVRF